MNQKIICVDDDRTTLMLLYYSLQSEFHVYTASSGAEALLTMEREGPFALVIADLQMPEMNGIEFLLQVRKLYPTTCRLLLSGECDITNLKDALNHGGIIKYHSKPWKKTELIKSVHECIETHNSVVS